MLTSTLIDSIVKELKTLPMEKLVQLTELLQHWKNEDARKYSRKQINAPVEFIIEDKLFKKLIKNMSPEGIFINTKSTEKFEDDQELDLIFELSDRHYRMKGKIIRKERNGIAVKFLGLTEDTMGKIERELITESSQE